MLRVCQYLSQPYHYTLTNVADYCERFSHDAINGYLRDEQITPRRVWKKVRGQGVPTLPGDVVFDSTVLDEHALLAIERVRWQPSGSAKAVIKGLGEITCVYVYLNPAQNQFEL